MSQEDQKIISREEADAALTVLRDFAGQRRGEVTNLRSALAHDATTQTFDSVELLLNSLPEAVDE